MARDFIVRKVGTREQPLPKISAKIFLQDPLVAQRNERIGLTTITLDGEACLGVGPTSSRVAVVDYNADLDQLAGGPAHPHRSRQRTETSRQLQDFR